jgi:TonB family protein
MNDTREKQFNDISHQSNYGHHTSHRKSEELNLTLLADASLSQRLFAELQFVIQRLRLNWPVVKKDPIGFAKAELTVFASALKRRIFQRQRLAGVGTSVVVLASLLAAILILEERSPRRTTEEPDQFDLVTTVDLSSSANRASGSGVGAGERARVGFRRGSGEGSQPLPARSHGGGGGGMKAQLAASKGRLPLPSNIPAPIPTALVRLPQALPVGGIDLDPALWQKLDYSSYGDPRSKSTTPSNGSGDGGGVGNGSGTGIGEGDGPGFGPGSDGNIGGSRKGPGGGGIGGSRGTNPNDDPDRVYKLTDVSTRPRVITKPEPQYTEAARRNQVTGTVVLRVVFSSGGQVTNIQAVQKLSDGLTEKAIAAARQIRFVPATRDGQPVSMYMQLEYNFNLY